MELDAEERKQVVESTGKAIELLKGSKKEHKKGILALLKLTGKKEYVATAAQKWMDEQGGAMTVDFLEHADLENDMLHDLLEDHLKLLQNVCRMEKFVRPLVQARVVDALLRVLGYCPVSDIVARALKVIGLLAGDATAVSELIQGDAIAEIMNHVSIQDEAFLSSVLPRLLRDSKMMNSFCEHGGISYLHGVLLFEDESTPRSLAGVVAAISAMAKVPNVLALMLAEDEFISCYMVLLRNADMSPKIKVHVVRTLYLIAQDPIGFEIVSDAVLPLMELIEDRDPETLGVTVAAFDLLGLLCNTTDSIALVEEYGGEAFIRYLLCFLKSPKAAVVEPLCGLLHVLALGEERELILQGIEDEISAGTQHAELLQMTLDLVGGGQRRTAKRRNSTQTELEDLGTVDLPAQRMPSRVTQTARQGAKRGNVIKEIVSTERTYYAGLFSVTKCFLEPLKKHVLAPKPVVSQADVEMMFGNVAEIYEMHKNFMKRLDQRVKQNKGDPRIADLFVGFAEQLSPLYKKYFATYPRAIKLIAEKEKKVKGFRTLLTELTKKIVRGGMGLENYLVMPVQRVPRYAMLLRELDDSTLDVHPDKPQLAPAIVQLEQLLAELDKVEPLGAPAGTMPTAARSKSMRRASSPSQLRRSNLTSSLSRASAKAKGERRSLTSLPVSTEKKREIPSIVSQSWSPSSNVSSDLPDRPVTLLLQPRSGSVLELMGPSDPVRLAKNRETIESRRPLMEYKASPLDSVGPVEVKNPIILDGYVIEMPSRLVRKMILLHDRLNVMTCPGLVEISIYGDPFQSTELPSQVHSFPLRHLRFEKEQSYGLRLFDTRHGDDSDGLLVLNETEDQNNFWIEVIFEQLDAFYSSL